MRIFLLFHRYRAMILMVSLLCICGRIQAQTYWNKTYVENRPLMYFSSIQKKTNSYIIIGGTRSVNGTNFTKILLANIDEIGNFIDYHIVGDSLDKHFGAFYNSMLYDESEQIFYAGYSIDTTANFLVLRKDLNLDTVYIYEYCTPNSYAFQGYNMQKIGEEYYVCGVHNFKPGFNSNVALLKIGLNGELWWQRYYDQKAMDYARSMVKLTNGNLLLGAVRNNLNQTNEKSNTWLLEVDTGGNVVREWFDPSDSTYAAEGLLQTQDGGFIYGAQKKREQSVNEVYKTATIVKLDSSFNKQWVYNNDMLSPTGFTDIEILPDGSYIACGTKNYRYACVVKLSSEGDLIWSREYVGISDWGSSNFLADIDVLPDGGFVAVGQSQQSGVTPPQVGWFLKLDSNGCEIENCVVGLDEIQPPQDKSQIQVYPNPASSSVQLEVSSELIGGEVRVYAITGRMMKAFNISQLKTTFAVSDLSEGLYIVRVQKEEKFARAKLVVE
jgi:hypothetical protein